VVPSPHRIRTFCRTLSRIGPAGLGILLVSCAEDGTGIGPDAGAVASVSISAVGSTVFAVGDSLRLQVSTLNPLGESIAGSPVLWSSADVDVARVDPTGLVTGIGPGQTEITARSGGELGHIALTVEPRPAEGIDPPTPVPPVVLTNWYLPVGFPGTPYSHRIDASGGAGAKHFEVVGGALPTGISLDPVKGTLTGVPHTPGTAHFRVRVRSGGTETARPYALSVSTVPASGYNIALVNVSGTLPSPAVSRALDEGVARWEAIIASNLPTFTVPAAGIPAELCQGHGAKLRPGEEIEDLAILIDLGTLNGPLASAGPCGYYFIPPSPVPYVLSTGSIRFDLGEMSRLDAGQLRGVVIHEIGHVIGIGSLWQFGGRGFLVGEGEADPHFVGSSGVAAYHGLGGSHPHVPVENTGGSGTRDAHWRESVFRTEIMTGYLEGPGVHMPLSTLTIGAVADLGYEVNPEAADGYALPGSAPAAVAAQGERISLDGDLVREPFLVELPGGEVRMFTPPR